MTPGLSSLFQFTKSTIRFYGSLFLVFLTLLFIMFNLSVGYRENLVDMRKKEIRRLVEIGLSTIAPILNSLESGEITRDEARLQVRNIIRRMTYRSETMNNYLFMSTYDGYMMVQPLEPELEDTYQWDSRDSKGVYYIRDLVKAARSHAGEGFVLYSYPPPGSSNPGQKLSYVKGIDSLGCYIGTGMYFYDINTLVRRYLMNPLIIIVVTFIILTFLFLFFLRPLAQCFQVLVRSFHEISMEPFSYPRIVPERFQIGSEEYEILSGFEKMLKTLETSQKELNDKAARLQKEVEDRIRAEKEAEIQREQLIRTDKMASLGILVTGVAHEINNPNQFILSNSNLLGEILPYLVETIEEELDNPEIFLVNGRPLPDIKKHIFESVKNIEHGSQRINKIVSDLKNFAAQENPGESAWIDLKELIDAALNLCGNFIKKATDHFTLNLPQPSPRIWAQPQRLEQVIINLLQNACQSLTSREKRISLTIQFSEKDNRCVIEVQDEGSGIPPRELSRITDPFFTTRRETGGTGLGLSISQGIIRDHQGKIEFFSTPGKGTLARITLPVKPQGAEEDENC